MSELHSAASNEIVREKNQLNDCVHEQESKVLRLRKSEPLHLVLCALHSVHWALCLVQCTSFTLELLSLALCAVVCALCHVLVARCSVPCALLHDCSLFCVYALCAAPCVLRPVVCAVQDDLFFHVCYVLCAAVRRAVPPVMIVCCPYCVLLCVPVVLCAAQ
jgi:hypothetical protein